MADFNTGYAGTGAGVGGTVGGLPGAAIGAGLGLAAGIVQWWIETQGEEAAQKLLEQAQDRYGQLTEESIAREAQNILGPSEFAKIQTDPAFRTAQLEALGSLKNVSDSGGLTLADKANLNDIRNEMASRANADRLSALQGLAERGLSGSGAEVAMLAQGSQSAANRASNESLRIAGQAQLNALEAMKQRGALAGQMQAADWNRKSDAARAQDAINRLNWGHQGDIEAQRRALAGMQYGFQGQRAGFQQGQSQKTADVWHNSLNALSQAAPYAAGAWRGQPQGQSAPPRGQSAGWEYQGLTGTYPKKDDGEED